MHRIGWLVGLVLLQILILNSIHIVGYVTSLLYIYFTLRFAPGTSRNELMLWAFLFGLTIDIFADTPGMNATVTTLLIFLHPSLLRLPTLYDNLDSIIPSFKSTGITPLLEYTTASVSVHSLALFSIEFFSFTNIRLLLLRMISCTFLTLTCILAVGGIRRQEQQKTIDQESGNLLLGGLL